ncbi:Uncharacterised protein [Mycobacteroides abscessus]|nr:Uncharacterised protein [Mycobacteroides abscessus]
MEREQREAREHRDERDARERADQRARRRPAGGSVGARCVVGGGGRGRGSGLGGHAAALPRRPVGRTRSTSASRSTTSRSP